MSWFSKKVLGKIKKIKPLKAIEGAAKKVGTAVAVGASVIGAVKAVRGAASAAIEETKRVAAEEGISEAEAAGLVTQRAAAGAQAGVFAGRSSTQVLLIGAVVVVALVLLARRK